MINDKIKEFKKVASKVVEQYTLDELKQQFNLPKTTLLKVLKELDLIYYVGRTPYTKQLIPVVDDVSKYQDKKKRQKTNDLIFSEGRPWPDNEVEFSKQEIKNIDLTLGALYCELSQLTKRINDFMERRNEHSFTIDICEKIKEAKDYCGYVEELRFGKRPETPHIKDILNDEIVIGYLARRLSPAVVSILTKEMGYQFD